ncbi:MAG: 4a-hydroxytetrahydrobiopterin dehydratase [Alphaproteobacteria bacterium]|nr:4a-hydroxytetrahydrobiopterin dehydratase [Alphaproteobacteria bacterium]
MELHDKSCTPCKRGERSLGPEEIAMFVPYVPQWQVSGGGLRLVRDFRFETYAQILTFVAAAGAMAEQEGHHPDICFGWCHATVALSTHELKGLHENDFIMAAKIDRLCPGLT